MMNINAVYYPETYKAPKIKPIKRIGKPAQYRLALSMIIEFARNKVLRENIRFTDYVDAYGLTIYETYIQTAKGRRVAGFSAQKLNRGVKTSYRVEPENAMRHSRYRVISGLPAKLVFGMLQRAYKARGK